MRRLATAALVAALTAFGGGASAAGVDSLFATMLVGPDNEPVRLEDYRGKPLIVNFWARWCAPCRTEIPELVELQAAFGERGLRVVGIAIEEDAAAVKEFLAAHGVKYRVGLGREKGIWLMQALGNARALLPFTLLIDRDGEIVLRKLGTFKKEDFDQVADRLLQ